MFNVNLALTEIYKTSAIPQMQKLLDEGTLSHVKSFMESAVPPLDSS